MKPWLLTICCLFFATPAFAEIHKRYFAQETAPLSMEFGRNSSIKPAKSDLVISGWVNNDRCTNFFGYVDLVFENRSEEWIDLQNMQLYFPDEAANGRVSIVVEPQLSLWNESDNIRRNEERKNAQIAAALVSGMVMVSAEQQGHKTYSDLGKLGLGVSAYSLSKGGYKLSAEEKKLLDGLPDTHALKGPYLLPPGLFRTKWVLFNTKQHDKTGYLDVIALDFDLTKGREAPQHKTWYLRIRNKNETNWQGELKERKGKNVYYID